MSKTSSFSETVNNLVKNSNIALESLVKINETLSAQSDSVNIQIVKDDPITGDSSTYTYSIPSYSYTMNQLSRISNSVDSFLNGKGTILLEDGTYREIKTTAIAKAPSNIIGVSTPTKFNKQSDWFTADFLYPKLYVNFDLKDKIDDKSDRVVIKKIIFNNFDDNETQWFKDNFVGTTYTYYGAIQKLNNNGKSYREDQTTSFLPLSTTPYTGSFHITKKETINNNIWYYLNTFNYSRVSDTPVPANLELKVGDILRYGENSLFKIVEIVSDEQRVRLAPHTGLDTPAKFDYLYYYSAPFREKNVRVNVDNNECDIVFFKGVNENFNIIGSGWGDSVSFYTGDLTLEGNNAVSFSEYFKNNIFDLGEQFEGMVRNKNIPAYFGVKPNAPVLNATQFRVVQVNKQLNASLDKDNIKTTQAEIESTKTIINSIKETIAQQKAELVELTDPAKRRDLQTKIDTNVNQLSKKTTEYQSLVKSLSTVATENDISEYQPKYRVRGFFAIPKPKARLDIPNADQQEIVQFEISYRYLRLDNTGNPLETFVYTDPSTGEEITGTFTDWKVVNSPKKEKVFDSSTGKFKWVNEAVSNGEIENINQIDIPIQKGEKVQVRIRSLSEAGYPINPEKSDWSNRVIIDFPANLSESNQVTNILADAQDEQTTIKLNETLDAQGVTSHLRDGIPNPNEGDGTYFKHQSRYLSYSEPKRVEDGNIETQRTVSLQSHLENLQNRTYVTVNNPAGGGSKTILLSDLFQSIVNTIVSGVDSAFYNNL